MCEHTFGPKRGLRCSELEAREAISRSLSYAEGLRRLGMRPAGGDHATLRRYAQAVWVIPTDHFDADAVLRAPLRARTQRPLSAVMIKNCSYSRGSLKRRLFSEGLKVRRCELCGQGENWHGRSMSLILDHVNGVANDHRLENLRVVCPNCAATLETHCGRQNRLVVGVRLCPHRLPQPGAREGHRGRTRRRS